MNLNQLGIQRLKIAIQAVENDSRLQISIKQAFKSVYQSLSQHSTSIQIIQTQLTDRISTTEFNYSLTQKLSINQFLQYFKKVEKLMEKVQAHSSELQRNLYNYIDKNFEECEMQLEQVRKKQLKNMELQIKQHFQQEFHKNSKDLKLDCIKRQIEKIKTQIQEVKLDTRQVSRIIAENDKQNEKKTYSNIKQQQVSLRLANQKLNEEIKHIKEYCLQSNKYVRQLYQDNKLKKKTESIVTFHQFQSAIDKIENKINFQNSIKHDSNMGFNLKPSKFMWNFTKHKQIKIYLHSFNSQIKGNRQVVKVKKNSINIQSEGIYRITLGIFLSNTGKIYLNLNEKTLIQAHFQKDMSSCISKTMILYAFISESSIIELKCDATGQCRGFLQIKPF